MDSKPHPTNEQPVAEPEKDLGKTETLEEDPTSVKAQGAIEGENGMLMVDPEVIRSDPEWKAKEKALVRRLDITFMPLLWILYFHNYLDRNNIA